MATHSSILHWRIPWSEEPGRLQSTGSQKVGHDWVTSLTIVGLPRKSHRQRNLADYSPLDGRRVGYDLVTEQQQQIVVLQCCVSFWCIAKWLSYTHTHVFFLICFSILIYFIMVIEYIVPYATHSRTLLFIYFICSSLYLLTPNSYFIPHSSPSCLITMFVLYVCECFCFIAKFIVPYFRFNLSMISYGICLSLSDLIHLIW